MPHSLGTILTTIEFSLRHWESCKNEILSSGHSESVRFASFLGRSRFHLPFLDQRIGDPLDDADEAPVAHSTRSSLPLLRELPVDPLTLCKASSCFAKLKSDHPSFKTKETLTRVSLRLFSSRNGRLLKECPLPDLVRLIEAAALSKVPAYRELIGLFSRRALHVLNELPRDEAGALQLNLSSQEICTLVFSLGELGVSYMPFHGGDDTVAHRRLHLIARPRLPNPSSLAQPSAIKLVSIQGHSRFLLPNSWR